MIELELDGKKIVTEEDATILEVALKNDKYIPHFCYHKKLSIAANCRMCLVEVEKIPKPVPSCATPVTEGMKIHTCSKLAVEAQKGVMEFLLINHPLDCPICDQGGECQLQDLAVGYGASASNFNEEKRAVANKDLGSLVTTEMTRCIHCTRCVRFTTEVAGYQELGMGFRNNHAEIMPFIGKTVDSELSGNIIDICPVGALTSKPFRFQARSWELSRRKSISPHDGMGSNIIAQVDKYHKVVRVLPLENTDLNECWLSDRDRFSYEGLYHEDRLTSPMIKQDGKWININWDVAIEYVAKSINSIKSEHGANAIGVLASPSSTTEELYLLQKLMRLIEVNNLDYRLGYSDFSVDGAQHGASFLGCRVSEINESQSILVIGSLLREEQPLLAYRVRQAVKNGAQLNVINVSKEDLLCEMNHQVVLDHREIAYFLAQLVKYTSQIENNNNFDLSAVEVSKEAEELAIAIQQKPTLILLGEIAKSLPNYTEVLLLVNQLIKNIQGKLGILSSHANETGAQLVGFVPYAKTWNNPLVKTGLNVQQMLKSPRKAYMLFNTELERDSYDSQLTLESLKEAETVIVMSAFVNDKMREYADVLLPIAPFTETSGSFVNMEGVWQKFNGVTKPLADTKPGWKVLRVLANVLEVKGFEYENIEDVRAELSILDNPHEMLDNGLSGVHHLKINKPDLSGLVRCGIFGIYACDSITRRAVSLQQTKIANIASLRINSELARELGVLDKKEIMVKQNNIASEFPLVIDDSLPVSSVFLAMDSNTVGFAGRFSSITIEAATT